MKTSLLLTTILTITIVFVIPFKPVAAQDNTTTKDVIYVKEAWSEIAKEKYLADYFGQFFNKIGIDIAETGEKVTIHNFNDHHEITDGYDEDSVDFVLHLNVQNIKNLLAHAKDGKISESEAFRLTSILFTPMTAKTLKNPVLVDNLPSFFSKLEPVTQVTLYNSDSSQSVSHTLIYVNDQWIVVPGLHGTPQRIYWMTVEESMLYQKKVMEAIKVNNKKSWREFKKWYMEWRESVSRKVR